LSNNIVFEELLVSVCDLTVANKVLQVKFSVARKINKYILIKPVTIQLVFVAFKLSTLHYRVKAKTGLL
jgi:hypothetical protein